MRRLGDFKGDPFEHGPVAVWHSLGTLTEYDEELDARTAAIWDLLASSGVEMTEVYVFERLYALSQQALETKRESRNVSVPKQRKRKDGRGKKG